MKKTLTNIALAGLIGLPLPSMALDILITNDDGFETANIQALYNALKDDHRVILAAPYSNQSGTSGSAPFLEPIPPASEASEGGSLPAGSWGVGETGLGSVDDPQYYANSTPVGAVLYGLELAQQAWGKSPDLVLSGPNDGNNLGVTTNNSGTVGATVAALTMGVPAIALSAVNDHTPDLVANLAVRLVDELERNGKVGLPPYTGLNVNFPILDAGDSADNIEYRMTAIGTSSNIRMKFYEQLSDSPLAQVFSQGQMPPLPGVSLEPQNDFLSIAQTGYPGVFTVVPIGPADESRVSETNVIQDGVVTISVIDGTYQAGLGQSLAVSARLWKLVR